MMTTLMKQMLDSLKIEILTVMSSYPTSKALLKMDFTFRTKSSELKQVESYVISLLKEPVHLVFYEYRENSEDENRLKFHLPDGRHEIYFMGHKVILQVTVDPQVKALSYTTARHRDVDIIINAEDAKKAREVLSKLIQESLKLDGESNKVTIRVYDKKRWELLSSLPKRDIRTIYIGDDEKNKLVEDISKFLQSKQLYAKFGIPYKRIYLLEGAPGRGKTSLIFVIASMFNKSISMFTISESVDDACFMRAINDLRENTILVLEDIDALFQERNSDANKNKLSFSALLNTLDGFGRKDGMLVFMTTNHIEQLDGALKRPGRIDYILSFQWPSKELMKKMFTDYFPNQSYQFEEVYNVIKNKQVSVALLQKFFFDNLSHPNIIEKIPQLKELVDFYADERKNMYT